MTQAQFRLTMSKGGSILSFTNTFLCATVTKSMMAAVVTLYGYTVINNNKLWYVLIFCSGQGGDYGYGGNNTWHVICVEYHNNKQVRKVV